MTSQLEPWAHLGGKVVMVTGASSGIGRDLCLDLAKAGCRIIAAARRIDRLESLCDEINGLAGPAVPPQRAVAVELDVSADGQVIEAAVGKAWESFGTIDALINNAGVRGAVNSSLDLSEEEWNSTIRTNLTGSWLVAKYVCLCMRNVNKGGSIINISSIAGLNRGHLPLGAAYASSKAAVNTLTKVFYCRTPGHRPIWVCLVIAFKYYPQEYGAFAFSQINAEVMAIELGADKIRVNSISPGLFKSEITEGLMQKDWLKTVALKTVPLRTWGTSDPALTSLVRYLIHDSSEYVSGNIFIADAGTTLPGVPIFSSL